MNLTDIVSQLQKNAAVFQALFNVHSQELVTWKQNPGKWCLLEIACHLGDEEREDFRYRVRHCLEIPEQPMPMFNPVDWVTERKYLEQDFGSKVEEFIKERNASIEWLNSLETANWKSTYQHPKMGPLTAAFFLQNWLAHDYLHIRQITRLKYDYLDGKTEGTLEYAGTWV